MESRRTKSEKTSTPGWNRCDASDNSYMSLQKRTSQRCPLFFLTTLRHVRLGLVHSVNGDATDVGNVGRASLRLIR